MPEREKPHLIIRTFAHTEPYKPPPRGESTSPPPALDDRRQRGLTSPHFNETPLLVGATVALELICADRIYLRSVPHIQALPAVSHSD